MSRSISREDAVQMINREVATENLKKHMHAVGAIMKELAKELGKDPEKWCKVGLLHDVDYEQTKDKHEEHALRSAQMLEGKLPEESLKAIKAHNYEYTETEPDSDLANALIAADGISGLIIATALVMPNSKLEEVRTKSVLKKFDDSSFAKNVDRDKITYCEKLGLNKEEFIEISLNALNDINDKLGL